MNRRQFFVRTIAFGVVAALPGSVFSRLPADLLPCARDFVAAGGAFDMWWTTGDVFNLDLTSLHPHAGYDPRKGVLVLSLDILRRLRSAGLVGDGLVVSGDGWAGTLWPMAPGAEREVARAMV